MSDIEELRRLIVGSKLRDDLQADLKDGLTEIQRDLDQVRERLDDEHQLSTNIARILPTAVAQADQDLSDALEKPMGAAIRRSIQKNPNDFADILFPIMGPAIRAAISDAMRSMMASINEMAEATLSVRGLKWRVQAWRAGVPYAEIALQNTLVYRVEQVFLINRKDSLLIGHTTAPDVLEQDSDAVSAMFSALQDFVRDSFSRNENDALREIEVGGHTVWSVHGPYAMLVAVVRGTPPSALRRRLLATLESIHAKYGGSLRRFEGQTNSIPGLESRLDECLELEFRQDAKGERNSGGPGHDSATEEKTLSQRFGLASLTPQIALTRILPVLLVASALVWYGVHTAQLQERHRLAVELIDTTPGFMVTDSSHDGRQIEVHGLQDPLAVIDHDTLNESGIESESVTLSMQAYLSLEPQIVERRARSMMSLPEAINITLDDAKTLHLSGFASEELVAKIDRIVQGGMLVPGVRQLDATSLRLSRADQTTNTDERLTDKRSTDTQ